MKRLVAAAALTLAACGSEGPVETAQSTTTTEWAELGPATHIERSDPTDGLDEALSRSTSTTARASRSRASTATTRPRGVTRVAATGDLLDALARCESHGNPRAVSPTGKYRGAFQFSLATWRANGGTGDPIDHTYAEQKAIAARIPVSAWGSQFPACSRRIGAA